MPANTGDARDSGLISGPGRVPGVGNSNLLHIPAWEIPRTEEHGELQSMGSQSWTPLSDPVHTYTRTPGNSSKQGTT